MGQNYDWVDVWNKPASKKKKDHVVNKKENYDILKDYLDTPPKKMLEIGCGIAREAEWFQKDYGTELWLLDGDKSINEPRKQTRYYNWGTADKFAFYSPIDDLRKSYECRDMTYRFVDANNIDIPDDQMFDLICSFKSCGFHYPISEYVDLIRKHSHENTKLIFDIRKDATKPNKLKETKIEIVNKIFEGRKHFLCEIKLS
jgi:SAM-dependent methyltransferase